MVIEEIGRTAAMALDQIRLRIAGAVHVYADKVVSENPLEHSGVAGRDRLGPVRLGLSDVGPCAPMVAWGLRERRGANKARDRQSPNGVPHCQFLSARSNGVRRSSSARKCEGKRVVNLDKRQL